MNIREKLKQGPFLFDGAMGTYFTAITRESVSKCELSNISAPQVILDIHKQYIEAGADAITTNTFSINRLSYKRDEDRCRRLIEAAWKIANEAAAGTDTFIFADIGPVTRAYGDEQKFEEYKWLVDVFFELGARNFLFESQAETAALKEISNYIKSKDENAFVMVCFSVNADGFTVEGNFSGTLLFDMAQCPNTDVLGFNCGCSAGHMMELTKRLRSRGHDRLAVAFMPNAGYPTVIGNRTLYEGDPYYFATKLGEIIQSGGQIVGGCCGTTPAHIREARKIIDSGKLPEIPETAATKEAEKPADVGSEFWHRLRSAHKVFAVELDPPADIDLEKFMKGVKELKAAGTDIITIADCPIGRARMDSSLLACKIRREEDMEALPHMTCRDRNLNATKALLLGLYAEKIRNVLLVTGDPVPTAEKDEVKSVYQFNSRKLAAFVSSLNERIFPYPMNLFGALNVNARNFDIQLALAKEKEKNGIVGFLTQPVLTPEALENLKRAKEELSGFILGGIIPIVSERNARFMDSEISGIKVDPEIIELYVGKDRAEAEDLAVSISTDVARKIQPYVDGYYLMTPFQRTSLIVRIMDEIRKL